MLSKPTRKELRATIHPLRQLAESCAQQRIDTCGTINNLPAPIWWRGFTINADITLRDAVDRFADEPYNLYQIRYRLIFMEETIAEGFNGSDFVREVFKAFATVPTLLDMAMVEIRRKLESDPFHDASLFQLTSI